VKDLLQHHKWLKNKEEMIQTMQEVWEQVSLEQLQRLISSMPNRMQAIISTKGGSTRW
jgi:arsenate reductase-like glutaredoxin family protein